MQAQINVQVGKFPKVTKHAAGDLVKNVKCTELNKCSVNNKLCEIQLSLVLIELEWFLC